MATVYLVLSPTSPSLIKIKHKQITGTTVALLLDFGKFARNVRCVAIQYWSITISYLTRMIQHDYLQNFQTIN